ncbi:hypothetical protein [Kitasatospora sp. GAS1066B]|uniref:hypothetical protein n=1 Tax=Kitasatospora sp. GAS1066B TaxID=3156271 RepID=UPI00351197B9
MSRINDLVAARATRAFGSMPATYALAGYCLLPLAVPGARDQLLYWSNAVQLVALPLLMVGQAVLSRAAEARATETHDAVIAELALLRAHFTTPAAATSAAAPAPPTPKDSAMPSRPTDANLDQAQQAALITETHNGPTEANEEQLLAARFGAPDSRGVYGAPTTEGTTQA